MYKYILFTALIILSLSGCKDFLEEEPKSFAAAENLFNSEKAALQVLYGINESSANFWRERYFIRYGRTGDVLFKGLDNNQTRNEFDDYTFTSSNPYFGGAWAGPYQAISRANLFIENMQNFEDGPFKERAIGEARFFRGFFYFMLVRSFGEVPLLTSYEDAELFPSRASIPQVYEQIIQDLEAAAQVLPGWQEITAGEKGRATRGAAKAFLGKVYLTMATTPETADAKYFGLAVEILKNIIDIEGYGLIDTYVEAFQPQNESGPEDVWSHQFLANAGNANQGYFNAQFQPNPSRYNQRGFGRFVVLDYVYELFESQDERRVPFLDNETYTSYIFDEQGNLVDSSQHETPNNWYFTWKYLDPVWDRLIHNQANTNLPLLRYSDVLLMYSEASLESQAVNEEAYEGIDKVRQRAGASPLPRGLDTEQLRQRIRDERILEFYGEGQRYFDLQRWGIIEQRIKEVKPYANIQWPKHRFFPIPQPELDVNKNLTQNPGYE